MGSTVGQAQFRWNMNDRAVIKCPAGVEILPRNGSWCWVVLWGRRTSQSAPAPPPARHRSSSQTRGSDTLWLLQQDGKHMQMFHVTLWNIHEKITITCCHKIHPKISFIHIFLEIFWLIIEIITEIHGIKTFINKNTSQLTCFFLQQLQETFHAAVAASTVLDNLLELRCEVGLLRRRGGQVCLSVALMTHQWHHVQRLKQ